MPCRGRRPGRSRPPCLAAPAAAASPASRRRDPFVPAARARPTPTAPTASPPPDTIKEIVMTTYDRTTPVTVTLRAQRGTVDITAADGAAVQVDVVPLDGSDAAAEAAAQTQVALEGDTLYIQTPNPTS